VAKDPKTTLAYDNYDYKDTKRDQLLGHTNTIKAMTTSYIIKCPQIRRVGLRPDMHYPTKKLDFAAILDSPHVCGGDEITPQITRALISDVIRRVHGMAVGSYI
jgi:hypothetical protein